MKILNAYQIVCNFCRKPLPLKDLQSHEGACERSKCSNELCGLVLANVPDTVKFIVAGEEKISCSKKCKKVTKFSMMMRRNSESEVLRAFESMLRKKSGKKVATSSNFQAN
jgi:hypothetical protein